MNCRHDPKRLVEYYMELQKRHKDRLVAPADPTENDRLHEDT